jgi:NhaA family Na+:H+ antiporter
MVVPALLYVLVAGGGEARDGWGIPMATDIAMAVGIVALLGSRIHPSLKLFLLALAIVDDIGAIVVIAVFYSEDIDPTMLALAAAAVVAIVVMRAIGVRWPPVFVAAGVGMWLAMHEAGVHATLAGVICGLLAPTVPHVQPDLVDADELADVSSVSAARSTVSQARSTVSEVEWLEYVLHPWTSFLIVPLFALANAGITISGTSVDDALGSRVALGVVLGLVVGKPIGISLASWLAVRCGVATLPAGVAWSSLVAVSAIAGIGFTVSLFITELAFTDEALVDEAKMAVLAASTAAALIGTLLAFVRSSSRKAGAAAASSSAQVV